MANSIAATAVEVLRRHGSISEALRSSFGNNRENFVHRSQPESIALGAIVLQKNIVLFSSSVISL